MIRVIGSGNIQIPSKQKKKQISNLIKLQLYLTLRKQIKSKIGYYRYYEYQVLVLVVQLLQYYLLLHFFMPRLFLPVKTGKDICFRTWK